jgi:hypothetical protein
VFLLDQSEIGPPIIGPIPISFGPVIGPVNPGRFRHVLPEKRQIVRPTREKYGKMPGFGLFHGGLISVRFYEKT